MAQPHNPQFQQPLDAGNKSSTILSTSAVPIPSSAMFPGSIARPMLRSRATSSSSSAARALAYAPKSNRFKKAASDSSVAGVVCEEAACPAADALSASNSFSKAPILLPGVARVGLACSASSPAGHSPKLPRRCAVRYSLMEGERQRSCTQTE